MCMSGAPDPQAKGPRSGLISLVCAVPILSQAGVSAGGLRVGCDRRELSETSPPRHRKETIEQSVLPSGVPPSGYLGVAPAENLFSFTELP